MENIRELIKYSGFLGGSGSGSGGTGGAQPDLSAGPGEPGHVLNRTHWVESGEVVLLPETAAVIDPDIGQGLLLEPILDLKDGNEYTVMWNGTEYKCTALYMVLDGASGSALGNFDLMSGTGDSGEPFVIVALNPESAATTGISLMIMPLDGSETVTVSISGVVETVHTLGSKYLPDGVPYAVQKPYSRSVLLTADDDGLSPIVPGVVLTEGNTYIVNYNGTDYTLECKAGNMGNVPALYLGVGSMVGGESSDEPFAVIALESPVNGANCFAVSYDGATQMDITITGENLEMRKLDKRLLPDGTTLPFVANATIDGDSVTFEGELEWGDFFHAYKAGRDIVINCYRNGSNYIYRLDAYISGKLLFGCTYYNNSGLHHSVIRSSAGLADPELFDMTYTTT